MSPIVCEHHIYGIEKVKSLPDDFLFVIFLIGKELDIIGGALGLYGITLAGALVLSNICAINAYGIPFTAPITPFNLFDMRDVVVRKSWQSLQKEQVNIQSYPGSEIK